MRRVITWVGLLAAGLLLPAAADRPVIPAPSTGPEQVNYTIEGGSLTIFSHPDYREFRYGNGVTFSGEGIKLTAGELVVEVEYGDVTGREKIKLPTPEPGELERDPSGTAAELAREIYLPAPELTPEMLRLIQASGVVRVTAENMTLCAPRLASTDGGKTWQTDGRAQVCARDRETGSVFDLAADELGYNIETQAGQARGNITAGISGASLSPVEITASQLDFDAIKQQVIASGQLKAVSDGLTLCCGTLTADLTAQLLSATDHPQVTDSARQLSITAERLSYNLASQVLSASGEVVASDGLHDACLTAGQVEYATAQNSITATGQPRLVMGNSTYTGETLRAWREEDGKLVVEVLGTQSGRIDLSQFAGAQADAE